MEVKKIKLLSVATANDHSWLLATAEAIRHQLAPNVGESTGIAYSSLQPRQGQSD